MTHCWNYRFDGLMNGSWRAGRALAAAIALLGLAGPAGAVCVGDCNDDGRVSIAETQACVNLSSSLPAPACAAADQNNDGTVDANEVDLCIQAFLDAATCPMVFTPAPTVTRTNTSGPTATPAPPTNTVPPTQTFTPTPTPTIAEQVCVLKANPASQIQIHIAALPVPLTFGLSGSIKIGASPADETGLSPATCSVDMLNPVNIPAIGFVCISPGAGCPAGRSDCDGGTPLGIDVTSNGNAGTCTNNPACQTICNTECGGAANVLSSACTGSCSGSTPETCTNDTDCLGNDSCTAAGMPAACCTGVDTGTCGVENGACNGPDNQTPEQANLCQCTCVETSAHGPSEAGDLQCNLGSSLVVETGAPCGNGDVLIAVGSTCIPVTTQRASSLISNANFADGKVPNPPNVNDLQGTAVSCETVQGGSVSGLSGVGAVNFFGSALGDLSVGLKATCQ